MVYVRCPRCKEVHAFAEGQKRVCGGCNYPGPEVRMESRPEPRIRPDLSNPWAYAAQDSGRDHS